MQISYIFILFTLIVFIYFEENLCFSWPQYVTLDDDKLMTFTFISTVGDYNHVAPYARSYLYDARNWTWRLVETR